MKYKNHIDTLTKKYHNAIQDTLQNYISVTSDKLFLNLFIIEPVIDSIYCSLHRHVYNIFITGGAGNWF